MIATVPLLIWGPDALIAVEILLVAPVAVVGYVAARSVPVSRLRAILIWPELLSPSWRCCG